MIRQWNRFAEDPARYPAFNRERGRNRLQGESAQLLDIEVPGCHQC